MKKDSKEEELKYLLPEERFVLHHPISSWLMASLLVISLITFIIFLLI